MLIRIFMEKIDKIPFELSMILNKTAKTRSFSKNGSLKPTIPTSK